MKKTQVNYTKLLQDSLKYCVSSTSSDEWCTYIYSLLQALEGNEDFIFDENLKDDEPTFLNSVYSPGIKCELVEKITSYPWVTPEYINCVHNSRTILGNVCEQQEVHLMELLLDKGADVDCKNLPIDRRPIFLFLKSAVDTDLDNHVFLRMAKMCSLDSDTQMLGEVLVEWLSPAWISYHSANKESDSQELISRISKLIALCNIDVDNFTLNVEQADFRGKTPTLVELAINHSTKDVAMFFVTLSENKRKTLELIEKFLLLPSKKDEYYSMMEKTRFLTKYAAVFREKFAMEDAINTNSSGDSSSFKI